MLDCELTSLYHLRVTLLTEPLSAFWGERIGLWSKMLHVMAFFILKNKKQISRSP